MDGREGVWQTGAGKGRLVCRGAFRPGCQARLRSKTGRLGEARGQQREGRLERMSMKRCGDGATGELSDTSEHGPRTVLPGNISVISRDHLLSAVSPLFSVFCWAIHVSIWSWSLINLKVQSNFIYKYTENESFYTREGKSKHLDV